MLEDVWECEKTALMGWNTAKVLCNFGLALTEDIASKAKDLVQEFVVVLGIGGYIAPCSCTLAEGESVLCDVLAVEVV